MSTPKSIFLCQVFTKNKKSWVLPFDRGSSVTIAVLFCFFLWIKCVSFKLLKCHMDVCVFRLRMKVQLSRFVNVWYFISNIEICQGVHFLFVYEAWPLWAFTLMWNQCITNECVDVNFLNTSQRRPLHFIKEFIVTIHLWSFA